MNIRYPIYEGVYRILTTIEGKSFRLVNLPFYLLAALPEVLSKL